MQVLKLLREAKLLDLMVFLLKKSNILVLWLKCGCLICSTAAWQRKNIRKIWLKACVIALLKPGKDPFLAKSFGPISLLPHLYKLFERLILERLSPAVESHLISQQAGFHPGKSTTGQLLCLIEISKMVFKKGMIKGAVFVDLSAACGTVNHRLLLKKIHKCPKMQHLQS